MRLMVELTNLEKRSATYRWFADQVKQQTARKTSFRVWAEEANGRNTRRYERTRGTRLDDKDDNGRKRRGRRFPRRAIIEAMLREVEEEEEEGKGNKVLGEKNNGTCG